MKNDVAMKEKMLGLTTGEMSEDDVNLLWDLQGLYDALTDFDSIDPDGDVTLDDIHGDLCKLNGTLRTLTFYISRFEQYTEGSEHYVEKED